MKTKLTKKAGKNSATLKDILNKLFTFCYYTTDCKEDSGNSNHD